MTSNVAALTSRRPTEVTDGIYLERAGRTEPAIEEYLRSGLSLLPDLGRARASWKLLLKLAQVAEPELRQLNDAQLRQHFQVSCKALRQSGFLPQPVASAFASVREASRRVLGMRHHDVQLLGAWTLLQGQIAEMATGEGKTLVAALAASVGAGTGAAVHVVTVNDYLAERDARQNQPLFDYLGLTAGVIKQDMEPDERARQYRCDIAYISNKELVFDYLKDRIATRGTLASHLRLRELYRPGGRPRVVLRGLHMVIVDEADSVLIDEARTPLIISETKPETLGSELYARTIGYARRMQPGEHFELTRNNELWLKPAADPALLEMLGQPSGVWTSAHWRRELLQKALSALHCFHRDRNYIIADGKIQIVDEFTGRVMPDRSWEQGLHQLIEAKEGCELTGERRTLQQMTYQRFFRRYLLLSGMTGTAAEVAPELRRVYDLEVIRIPTHKPSQRLYLPNRCYGSSDARWTAVAERAAALQQAGRAVLIGTRSVEASEILSQQLTARDISHTVLNARQDSDEAAAVAEAGQRGRITVATNMAGRGTDIRPAPEIVETGGLHVILTEFHESSRIDRQLFGRSARQGQPGSVEAIVSLDDEIFGRFVPKLTKVGKRLFDKEGITAHWLLRQLVKQAQRAAERQNRRIRLETLQRDRKFREMTGFAATDR